MFKKSLTVVYLKKLKTVTHFHVQGHSLINKDVDAYITSTFSFKLMVNFTLQTTYSPKQNTEDKIIILYSK